VYDDKTAYESLDRIGTVITTQRPTFHDPQPRDTPTPDDPDSDNGFIPFSPEEETSPSLIRKETAISSSPSTSPSLIGHDDRTPPPRADPTENDQVSRTPATSNKRDKAAHKNAAHNEPSQTRLTQQSNKTMQGSEDDIDIGEIATRKREREREREREKNEREREHRSQTSSRNGSTNNSHGVV
jgi:hypothetical protein